MEIKRQNWADYVKAIAIFCMVICHAGVGSNNPGLCMFIYAFHMPVFFMISGYFEKIDNKVAIKQKLIKNIRSFIVPYLVFNLFGFTYCWYGKLNHPELNHYITASEIIPNGLLGIVTFQLSQTDYSFQPNGVLWFLMSLLQCKLLFMLASYLYRRSKVALSSVLVLLLVLAYYFISNRIETFVIGSTLLAFPFYIIGYITKKSSVIERLSANYSFVISILCFILLFMLVPLNGRPDIASVWYGNSIWLFYQNAIIGSLMCITFTKCLSEIPVLMYLGKNTLSVLCVHVFWVMVGKRVIGLMYFIPPYSFLYCALVSLFSVTASLMMGAYIMRRWPWMFGKWGNKKTV